MPKKTKQIEKEVKQEKLAPKTKKQQAESTQSDNDIFSQSFKERLNQFVTLNKEVVTLKSTVEDIDVGDEISIRRDRMATKVEEAAASILKNELSSLQQWIVEQQAKLEEEINKIEKAYEENRKCLLSTGSFTEDEVKSQLSNVQKKADQKKQVHESYGELLKRSKTIYS